VCVGGKGGRDEEEKNTHKKQAEEGLEGGKTAVLIDRGKRVVKGEGQDED